jgi:hypothetical protein
MAGSLLVSLDPVVEVPEAVSFEPGDHTPSDGRWARRKLTRLLFDHGAGVVPIPARSSSSELRPEMRSVRAPRCDEESRRPPRTSGRRKTIGARFRGRSILDDPRDLGR